MLTLVFATFNGQQTLPRMLESLTQLQSPAGGWKLVVVDNASTDDTPKILEEFKSRLPLTVLQQEKPGKNAALNKALDEIEGDLVVFTDDDVMAEPDWLVTLENLAKTEPDYDIFGGVIKPLWPETPPQWIVDQLIPIRIIYAITSEDLEEGSVHPGRIWGPNMAVRASVFAAGHRFDESVGPGPGQYRMGSETEFTVRIHKLGHQAWHTKACSVQHMIRPHQMDAAWAVQRGYRFGRDMYWKENDPQLILEQAPWPEDTPTLMGLPRWYYSSFVVEYFKRAWANLTGNSHASIKAGWEVAYWRGYFAEARAARKSAA